MDLFFLSVLGQPIDTLHFPEREEENYIRHHVSVL
jgi:hypothetical protein